MGTDQESAFVFFMQAGFCILEAGLTRAKNAGNIVMKNLMDFVLGTIVFWFIGFGIMQGTDLADSSEFRIYSLQAIMALKAAILPGHSLSSRRYSVPQRRLSFPALWQREPNSRLTVFTVSSSVQSFIRSPATGSGAAAGFPNSVSTTSQVPLQYIW